MQTPSTPFTYGYDFASRLSTITGGATATYGYDAGAGNDNGNRTSAPGQTLTYDAQDRISTAGYTHDKDGRRTFDPNNDDALWVYDDFGQLVQNDPNTSEDFRYAYDGLGRLVTQQIYDGTPAVLVQERRYLYAQGNRLVAMYDGSGNILQQYVYATGRHVPDAVVAGGILYRIVSDHLGSVRMVVRASDGTVVQRTDYNAWGQITTDTFSVERVPFGFAGGLRDMSSSGLVLMGARWYDPVTGRWITKDPVRFAGGFNLYGYVHNDPVNFFDRTGRGEDAFQDFFNKFWQWFNQLPPPAKGVAVAAAANAAAPYVAGLCLASPLFLTTSDTPRDATEDTPLPPGYRERGACKRTSGSPLPVSEGGFPQQCSYNCPGIGPYSYFTTEGCPDWIPVP